MLDDHFLVVFAKDHDCVGNDVFDFRTLVNLVAAETIFECPVEHRDVLVTGELLGVAGLEVGGHGSSFFGSVVCGFWWFLS